MGDSDEPCMSALWGLVWLKLGYVLVVRYAELLQNRHEYSK